jgi:hypothetical protein
LDQQIAAHPHDAFWQVVRLLRAQLDGMYEGYAAAITAAQAAGSHAKLLSKQDMLFLNSNGACVWACVRAGCAAAAARLVWRP